MEPFHKAKRALITRTKAFAIGPVIGNSQGKKDQMRQNDLQSKACANPDIALCFAAAYCLLALLAASCVYEDFLTAALFVD
ncbi:hypothetical protein Acr_15g0019640 [Actinidia rufa]|uniref:Uncharacterized protein n=1 Tax=Actinidia rufa TaxID=165716 RepID=A0A7J0FXF3_9ERIC|nr:hypothetical protein Acr_00g0003040 [Actinidia rufa]GFY99291.1 hypothetical protein Acr_13g0006920 [Actinidia rufa]GFZ03356.1 hypothetical protein Acr_15g0019640 [Actinidia rufa]